MTKKTSQTHRNLWALTVLCLLRERPMHPYEMQRLIRERKNDEFLDLKRGSLYHSIGRLQEAGFIEQVETEREGRRPERTVYRLTPNGEQELIEWLKQLVSELLPERSSFYAAISYLPHLGPKDACTQLETRMRMLEAQIGGLDWALRELVPKIGRLVLLEVEYLRAIRQAELDWVRAIASEIKAGDLTWDIEAILNCLRQNQKSSS